MTAPSPNPSPTPADEEARRSEPQHEQSLARDPDENLPTEARNLGSDAAQGDLPEEENLGFEPGTEEGS